MIRTILLIAAALLVLVGVGYYCAENPSGRLRQPLDKVGYLILLPGYLTEMALTRNVHASFGDWRDLLVKMGVPYLIYLALAVWLVRLVRKA